MVAVVDMLQTARKQLQPTHTINNKLAGWEDEGEGQS